MRIGVLIALLILVQKGFSQNLVPNGSFNDINICTEYTAPCAPSAWKTTSPLLAQYLDNDSVDKFVAIIVYNTNARNVRKYLQGRLLCPLMKGEIYKFSIKVKMEKVVIDNIGVLFSDTTLFFDKDVLIKQKPSIVINLKNLSMLRVRRKEWFSIDVEYKATGKEKYIIIGSFQSDQEQRKTFLRPPKSYTDYYIDIDDVSLTSKNSLPLCENYEKLKEELYKLRKRHTLHKKNIFPPVTDDFDLILKSVDTINLSTFLFEFDSDTFDPYQKLKLDSLLGKISKQDIEKVQILGFTDSIGTENYNQDLSLRRAEAIKYVFTNLGFPDIKLEVKGYGESKPTTSNSSEEGRKHNRRAELIINYKKKEPVKVFDKAE